MFSLEGQSALVTGASRGIGKAIAMTLAKQGAFVTGTATTQTGADNFSMLLSESKLKGQGLVLDVCHLHSIQTVLDKLTYQNQRPTILINNAGVTCDQLTLRLTTQDWQKVIDTHLTATFQITQKCLPSMLKANYGRIINISSIVGMTGNVGQSNYAAAKAGVIGFSKSLALEVAARGITVNVIAPGFIETAMTAKMSPKQKMELTAKIPCQKLGQPQDIANACIMLASKEAHYITGHTLHINGGMFMA